MNLVFLFEAESSGEEAGVVNVGLNVGDASGLGKEWRGRRISRVPKKKGVGVVTAVATWYLRPP